MELFLFGHFDGQLIGFVQLVGSKSLFETHRAWLLLPSDLTIPCDLSTDPNHLNLTPRFRDFSLKNVACSVDCNEV